MFINHKVTNRINNFNFANLQRDHRSERQEIMSI